MKTSKIKLSKDQKKALVGYEYALRQEDRFLGSIFVAPQGQREIEMKTASALLICKVLGMTHEHGL